MFIFVVIVYLKMKSQFHCNQNPFGVKRLRYPAPACELIQTSQSFFQCTLLPAEMQ